MEMNMYVTQLIKKHYVDTIPRQQTTIGIEVEMPLVSVGHGVVTIAFVTKLTAYMQTQGFFETKRTLDGYIYQMENADGDLFSFETSWNSLELSLTCSTDLTLLAKRLYKHLATIQLFCTEHGYYLCGRGINPNYANINLSPLNTKTLLAKSEYLKKFTQHHDGEIFHAISASTQTHLDAHTPEEYLRLFRLLRKLYAFEGLFFPNSPALEEGFIQTRSALMGINTDTLCFRDELWRNCGAPNIQPKPCGMENIDSFCKYLTQMKLFVVPTENGFTPIKPVRLSEYFKQKEGSELDLTCFRSLEPIAPTKNGSLEIRSTCTQPLDKLMEPVAFYMGMAANIEVAEALLDKLYEKHFPADTPEQVRDKLMKKSNTELRSNLRDRGEDLLEVAIEGLLARKQGEECFLLPLRNRLKLSNFQTPAENMEENNVEQSVKQINEGAQI